MSQKVTNGINGKSSQSVKSSFKTSLIINGKTNGIHSNGFHANGNLNGDHCPINENDDHQKKRKQEERDDGAYFLTSVANLILHECKIIGSGERVKKSNISLVEFKQPKDLEEELSLTLSGNKPDGEELIEFCKKVIRFSVKTTHPYFYNQLYGGIDEFSLAGSWLTEALNTSQATYEISPVFSLLERCVFKYLGSKCGWREQEVDGIFSPGGSLANIYGMILARHQKFPNIKTEGIGSLGKLVMFCSEDAHYSFVKGSIWMGHGSNSVIRVKTDERGRIDPLDLERQIQKQTTKGSVPFMIACTSGTTVLSAFDPIHEVVKVSQKYGIWLHVDAALGGTVLFSDKHGYLMRGIEEADSVTWNLHKLGGIPLQASAFLTRHPNLLTEANSLKAEYLFQNDKYYDASYDSGDKSIQCGRKVDSLKVYLGLFARGQQETKDLVDNVFSIADYVTDKIRKTPGFKLVFDNGFEGGNICFWYIPSFLRKKDGLLPDPEVLHKVCPAIKEKMMQEGKIMVNYQPLSSKKLPNFFRLVLTCIPAPNKEDMDFFVDEIARLGELITF